MKVVKFEIKNLFGIKEFSAKGSSLEITGDNATGKTSILDAFKLALTNKSDREYIIREGATEGEVIIETDTGVRVHRKIRTGKADYKSIKDPNIKGENTEGFLRTIFTNLQLNPIEFMSMTKDEQNRIVLDLIEFEWDLDWIKKEFGEIVPDVNYEQNILCVLHDIQADEGFYFVKRQNINRDVREKSAIVEDIGSALPSGYDAKRWDATDVGELYKNIARIQKENGEIEKAKQLVENRDNKVRGFKSEYEIEIIAIEKEFTNEREATEKKIAALENAVTTEKEKLSRLSGRQIDREKLCDAEYDKNIAEFDGEVKQFEDLAKKETTPTISLQADADEIQAMKAHINEYKRMKDYEDAIVKLNDESNVLTERIEHARELPGGILETCKIPVEGLTVVGGTPLINGLPISNLSEGEKLNLCVDIATQSEGSLDILLLDGIEKLSAANRVKLYVKLQDKGCQFLATRTTNDKDLTVIEL